MFANTLKKMLLTVAVAALAAVALAGTAVAVVALAGGLEDGYRTGGARTAVVSVSADKAFDVAGHGYYPSSAAAPYSVFDGLE